MVEADLKSMVETSIKGVKRQTAHSTHAVAFHMRRAKSANQNKWKQQHPNPVNEAFKDDKDVSI